MKEEEYGNILSIIRSHPNSAVGATGTLIEMLKEKFPHVSEDALNSIYSFDFQRRMKRERPKHYRFMDSFYNAYSRKVREGYTSGILLSVAQENSISPSLLARMILEKHYENTDKDESTGHGKNFISKAMKDTSLICDRHLAYEVYLCNMYDDQYGPITECYNYSVGQHYERLLQEKVQELNLPFHNEDHMRLKGYDKTPDIRLEIPFAVDGFIVNWIDSKALFGDVECHTGYLKEQFLSYWNRFGTGLVIYWYGYIDGLEKYCNKKVLVMDHFPSNVVVLKPKLINDSLLETPSA